MATKRWTRSRTKTRCFASPRARGRAKAWSPIIHGNAQKPRGFFKECLFHGVARTRSAQDHPGFSFIEFTICATPFTLHKALLDTGRLSILPLRNWKLIVRSVDDQPCVKTFARVVNGVKSTDPLDVRFRSDKPLRAYLKAMEDKRKKYNKSLLERMPSG